MRSSSAPSATWHLVGLLALARCCVASREPLLDHDPDTIPCREWHNNRGDQTCEELLEYSQITREWFHEWNPSVGLDCKPWKEQSYCILPEPGPWPSATAPPSPTITSAAGNPDGAPEVGAYGWTPKGCYSDDNDDEPLLKVQQEANNEFMTTPKCLKACGKANWDFAGLKNGQECWCGDAPAFHGREAEGEDECSTPCTGYAPEYCGGDGYTSLYTVSGQGDENEVSSGQEDDEKDGEKDEEEGAENDENINEGQNEEEQEQTEDDQQTTENDDAKEEDSNSDNDGQGNGDDNESQSSDLDATGDPESGAARYRAFFGILEKKKKA